MDLFFIFVKKILKIMEGRKHLYILILAILSFCPSFLPAMSERNLRILSELDQTISQKAVWQGERETRIRMLKKPVAQNDGSWPEISFV